MNQLRIKRYCHIKQGKVYLDGKLLLQKDAHANLNDITKSIFKFFSIKYPKFYKMDDISKLGFLSSELVFRGINYSSYRKEEVGLVLSNSNSTLITDSHFQESVRDYSNFYPSPSVFVYTLPNIMMGEISIRHGFRGENAFYIFKSFNARFIADYINQLFLSQKLKACLGGWVDHWDEGYEAFVYWADDSEDFPSKCDHTAEEIDRLYKLI